MIRVAEDMVELINSNPGADSFREEVLNALGEKIDAARKETSDASAARPAEAAALNHYHLRNPRRFEIHVALKDEPSHV